MGLIGLDTSHVIAFTRLLNDTNRDDHIPGARVVAAFAGGSPDIPSSRERLDGYSRQLQEQFGVHLVESIPQLCRQVDAVMLMSVDGRPHLWQAIPVIEAGKPLFIDKPMAASLGEVVAIFELARRHGVPVFSASSLRFGQATLRARRGAIGRVLEARTTSPYDVEPHHPELFWYGIHGVESLFTVLGPGCQEVRWSEETPEHPRVIGRWSGGRTGIYEAAEGYGGHARGTAGEMEVGAFDGYAPLVREIVRFFQTGIPPVDPAETIELFAFMEAASESRRRGGDPVPLAQVYRRCGYTPPAGPRLLSLIRLGDAAPHNAFTDLLRWHNRWFCTFREGAAHVSPDGAIRILTSTNGLDWEPAARLSLPGFDLQDPKLSIAPNGELVLLAAAARPPNEAVTRQSYTWFSRDGCRWDPPTPVGEPNFWLWRLAWKDGVGWGVGYATKGKRTTRLYRTHNGKFFAVANPRFFERGWPNEAALAFDPDGRAWCLLRRDGQEPSAWLGKAVNPNSPWDWRDLGVQIGGPALALLGDGTLVAGLRLYQPTTRTVLATIDRQKARLLERLTLPSGGDTGYPGLVWHDGLLWVSYYSSHEGKAAVYLARVLW